MRARHAESLLAVRLSDLTHELGPAHVHSAVDLVAAAVMFSPWADLILGRGGLLRY
jgi:hypothetical protein